MLKEFINRILDLDRDIIVNDGDGREYSTLNLTPVKEPLPSKIRINSLSGLVHYVKAGHDIATDIEWMIHVEDHQTVHLISALTTKWAERYRLVTASSEIYQHNFKFNYRYEAEDFIIKLLSQFKKTTHKDLVLKAIGNMKSGKVRTNTDDGITQSVAIKVGVELMERTEIVNPVSLMPYRTFLEVEQPESPFVFRVHDNDEDIPCCSLTEADGGQWKIAAIENIKKYFEKNLKDQKITIIA